MQYYNNNFEVKILVTNEKSYNLFPSSITYRQALSMFKGPNSLLINEDFKPMVIVKRASPANLMKVLTEIFELSYFKENDVILQFDNKNNFYPRMEMVHQYLNMCKLKFPSIKQTEIVF